MKILKPIATDTHFKYRCPNINCGAYHWLSLQEVKTKNFKVVCDCSTIFKPKQIKNIKIKYDIITHKEHTDRTTTISLDQTLEKDCISLLINNGFTEDESRDLIHKAYSINPENDKLVLVKYILTNIGALETNDQKAN
jgi:hypothetical protein